MVQDLYRAEPASDFILRSLDDVTLVYHRRSGQTHIVVSPVPEILAALTGGVSSPSEIVARLSHDYDLGDPNDAVAAVKAHLDEMVALGLAHIV